MKKFFNEQHIRTWPYFSRILAVCLAALVPALAHAQKQEIARLGQKLAKVQSNVSKIKPYTPPVAVPPSVLITEPKRVALSDGKSPSTKRHSIVPSAVTILGSPAIVPAGERNIYSLRQRAQAESSTEHLSPLERNRWKMEREALNHLWRKATPTPVEDLPQHLTHQVPPETLAYLQQQYQDLVSLIEETNHEIMPKVVYASLRNEGRAFHLEETKYINTAINNVRFKVHSLSKALNTDPYLLIQQKYWDRMFGAFNPLLKGVLAKPTSVFRQDHREFILSEFALHNPDGSAPYLPKSDSMIQGESMLDDDDDFDEEQYQGQPIALQRQMQRRAAERIHNQEMLQLAEAERDALLQNIPSGLRIAVINDDLLPLINFKGWAKKGYLGKDATVDTFREGFSFLQTVRAGTRYDIVITDLILPDGGVAMMEDFRLLDSNAAVFASSKFYPDDGDDHSAQDLFNFGMDGYIWNNSNLNEGSFGYLQYLRQMNNYYYYKNKYNWQR